MKHSTNQIIIVISIVVLISCSFIGYSRFFDREGIAQYFSIAHSNNENYADIDFKDTDVSGVSDMSNIKLNDPSSSDVYVPSKDELDKTLWDKDKINIDVQYHDDPMVIANRYGIPFGSNIVYDKSGNKMLLKSVATMAPPVYYEPSGKIYSPTSFVPSYADSILLRNPL